MTDTKWILAGGMRRAGSTWQYHLAKDLIVSHGGYDAKWVIWQEFDNTYRALDGKYPFVIFKTHAFTPDFTDVAKRVFDEGRGIGLYIYRDIRDVAASLLGRNTMTQTWNNVLANLPVILKNYEIWTSLSKKNSIVARYESFEPSLFLSRLDGMLPTHTSLDMVRKIIFSHTFAAHKRMLETLEYGPTGYNKDKLMWNNHMDSGTVGRYLTELDEGQIASVEDIAKKWLKERGYLDE